MIDTSRSRDEYWPEVERFFSSLPPALQAQATLLKNNLAILYSGTGQFRDILGRKQDYPLLELHHWLLDDFDVSAGETRRSLEKHLPAAMTLAFAAGYAHDCLLDQNSPFDNQLIYLENALTRQSASLLARLFPTPSPFWDYCHTFWNDYAEASLVDFQEQAWGPLFGEKPDRRQIGQKLAPAKLPAAAVALQMGREAALPALFEMMDALNAIHQVRRDILAIRYDLMRGRYTYPIVRTMLAAGIDPHGPGPAAPEQVLGALILTGSARQLCQESLVDLETCRSVASALHLPTFSAYFERVEALIRSLMSLFSLNLPQEERPDRAGEPVSFAPYEDPLEKALIMAEGYLLSDLTFREAWDVQRGGAFGAAEITARPFPAGLIVECLCRAGRTLPDQVDEIFRLLQENRFQYYDLPQAALPDADDLGLLLRLYRYSDRAKIHREILETPLTWMQHSVLPSGEIPVWFRSAGAEATGEESSVLIWGGSCAATETNLLLGLIDYDWAAYRPLIERAALDVCRRMLANGLGAALYYLPPYILWAGFELVAALSARPVEPVLAEALETLAEMLLSRFVIKADRSRITPQDAAFFILACRAYGPAGPLFDPAWVATLLKSQRYDGSWDDEPLFLVPDRNLTAWYSSRSATTAFCYRALKTHQAQPDGPGGK